MFCDDPSRLEELNHSLSRVDFGEGEEKEKRKKKFAKYIRLIPEDCLHGLVSGKSEQLRENSHDFLRKSNSIFASGFVKQS